MSRYRQFNPQSISRPTTAMKGQLRKRRQAADKIYKSYLSAAKATVSLKARMQALKSLARDPTTTAATKDQMKSLLKGCEDDVTAQEAANRVLLDQVPTLGRKSKQASHLAAKVFAVPEILEHILSFLDSADVLRAYRTDKTFYDTIEGSVKLQRALGLLAQPDGHLSIPAHSLLRPDRQNTGLHLGSPRRYFPYNTKGAVSQVKIEFVVFAGTAANIATTDLGTRCRQMLVSQPPIMKLHVYAHCCTRPPNDMSSTLAGFTLVAAAHDPTTTIISTTGITIGQVFEAVAAVREAHALCPEAQPNDYGADGVVRSKITIKGLLSLRDDDPVVVEKRRVLSAAAVKKQRQVEHEAKLNLYIAAKQAARASGNPIPTLEEFEATQESAQA